MMLQNIQINSHYQPHGSQQEYQKAEKDEKVKIMACHRNRNIDIFSIDITKVQRNK